MEKQLVIENNIIKEITSEVVNLEVLKQRFNHLKERKQMVVNDLARIQNEIQTFKDLLTKAGIDFKSW